MIGIPEFAKIPILNAFKDKLLTLHPATIRSINGFSNAPLIEMGTLSSVDQSQHSCVCHRGEGSSVNLMSSDVFNNRIDSVLQRPKYIAVSTGRCSTAQIGYSYDTTATLRTGDFSHSGVFDASGYNNIHLRTGDLCSCFIRTTCTVGDILFECQDCCALDLEIRRLTECTIGNYYASCSFCIGSSSALLRINEKEYKLWPNTSILGGLSVGGHGVSETEFLHELYNRFDEWYARYVANNLTRVKAEVRGRHTQPKREVA